MGKSLLIKNGHVIDPANKIDECLDIRIVDGMIEELAPNLEKQDGEEVMDVEGLSVMPGFVDLHVHFREPGFEYKETVKTGSQAAAAGGFTSVCPMPNTKPAIDSPERVRSFMEIVERDSIVHVYPVGAVTLGQDGNTVTDIQGMKQAGIVAISEDGKSVMDEKVYERGMQLAKEADLVVMAHCEDKVMVGKGAVNEGAFSKKYDIPGISNEVENVIARRDIKMATKLGVKLHLCHCSTKESVDYLREAKKAKLPITGEACPHHFSMSDAEIPGDDANYKMNPPLRAPEDVKAICEGLSEGALAAISTDHAPHGTEEKEKSMREAPFGIVGLETAFSLGVTNLVEKGYLTPGELVERMSHRPAQIIGIKAGNLGKGWPADLVIADFNEEYTIDKDKFYSKGKNTPFDGIKVKGRIHKTVVDGEVVFSLE